MTDPCQAKPSFVIILADDLGWGDLGCYGGSIPTPRIDQLALEGMRFTDFHSNGAVCSPTRAALVTGRYQQRCGIEGVVTAAGHRDTGMSLDETTFAEVLGQAGYATGLFGKWHLGYKAEFGPMQQGFDEYIGFVSGNVDYHSHVDQSGHADWWREHALDPEDGYTTDLITEHGADFIRRHSDQPFCLYLAHGAPHYPYQGRNDPPVRAVGDSRLGTEREDRSAAYTEMIGALDDGVGRIVDTIDELGLGEQTLVVFWSDNGPARVGSAGIWRGGKGTLWEGGHRVPAVFRRPGHIEAGTVSQEIAMGFDLMPTMIAQSGADLPAERTLDGIDLTPALYDGASLGERALFWRHRSQCAVRLGRWKHLVDRKDGESHYLFDLESDPAESADLAEKHSGIATDLRARLAAWEETVDAGVTRRA